MLRMDDIQAWRPERYSRAGARERGAYSIVPQLDKLLGEGGEEAGGRGVLGVVAAAVVAGEGEVELVLRAGDGYVEEAGFFFDFGGGAAFDDAAVGELPFAQEDDEDDFPLQALGLVDGGEGDGIGIGFGGGVDLAEQGDGGEEVIQVFFGAQVAGDLGEVFGALVEVIVGVGIFATFCLFGVALALSIPQAFLIKTAAGGVFKTNVKDLSSMIVTTTGITNPALSAVLSLNSLVKAAMLIP